MLLLLLVMVVMVVIVEGSIVRIDSPKYAIDLRVLFFLCDMFHLRYFYLLLHLLRNV